ncbi:MAG: sulfatase [Candidatus Anammoximicrobium sp.]|nr:sulfatase [Candidatus Anammoximicrobium sp.]
MKPAQFMLTALLVALPQAIRAADAPPSASRPSIVFVLADDLGWADLGVQGSHYYETPHIDRLAAQGMRLTCYHNCQNCAPTRAALISGQYAPRTGVYTVGGIGRFAWQTRPLRPVDNVENLPLDKITIAQSLKTAGYVTGLFGKWHLGQQGDYHPGRRGFDEAVVSMGKHFDFATSPRTAYPPGQYLADFLTDQAVDFIRRHKDRPFFLYLPHFAVHTPLDAKPELIDKFKTKPPAGGHRNPTYAAMIASVDASVGRVLATLDELKLAERTVVIFSSDNGGVGGYAREGLGTDSNDITDNAPLRSGKGSLYEGGTRDPFIVRWPGVTRHGSTCDAPAIHVDLYPTLLEIAGAEPPAGYALDGESLVPLFRGAGDSSQRRPIYQHFPGYLGMGRDHWRTTPVGLIHAGDWKLMEFFEDGRLELYNLRDDVGETKNLASQMPEKAQELYAQLLAWRQAIQAPMPTPHKPETAPALKPKLGRKAKGKAKRG